MRKELSQSRLLELLTYDGETGIFVRNITRGGQRRGVIAGSIDKFGYQVIRVDGYLYYGHHLAWLSHHGVMPKYIDHKNGIKSDNRISNLREVTHKVNMGNIIRKAKNHTQGVRLDPRNGNYQARYTVNGKTYHIGMFKSAEEASLAYKKAKRLVDPECAIAQCL